MKRMLCFLIGLTICFSVALAGEASMRAELQINTALRIHQSGWSDYSGYLSSSEYERIVVRSLESMLERKGIRLIGTGAEYRITVDKMLLRERVVKHTEKDPNNPQVKRSTFLAKVSIHLEGWIIHRETGERKRWRRNSSAKETLRDLDNDDRTPPRKIRMSPGICADISKSAGRRAARRLHRKMHRMD